MSKVLIIAALLAAVALAQPAVNAPLLPQYNFIEGGGKDAVVGVVTASVYGFTADSDGVWGMNMSAPSNMQKVFWDALPGVTQMWSWCGNWTNASSCKVYAIAGPWFVMYEMNTTTVWRAASRWTQNATFNIVSQQSSPSYAYPTIWSTGTGAIIVLGTQNTSNVPSGTYLPSTVYAFDAMTLNVVWATYVNSDTTNFQTANCSQYIWIMTQNQTGFNSDVVVRKLYPNNGTLLDWWFDTELSNTVQTLGVMNGQFMVLSAGGYTQFAWYNGSKIAYYSIPSTCSTMPYPPTLLNNTWYAICGYYVVMYDATTFARRNFYTSSNNIRCGAVHEWNQDFVLVAGQNVYVGNESGINLLVSLPNPISGSYSQCSGALFNWVWPGMNPMWNNITDIVHLSMTSSYSGSVLALNYRTGEVLAQAASNVAPLGAAIVDYMDRRLYVASTQGNILQGYEFVPRVNVTSFAADVSNSGSSATTFSVAYNATNRSTYYISTYDLYTVDYMGNVAQLGTYGYSYSSVQPLIVGQYLVFFDSYYDKVRIYDSVKKTLASVTVDEIDTVTQPVAFGTKVVVFNPYSSTAAVVIDVSASTPAAAEITASSGRIANGACVLGTTLIINTGYSTIAGYDFTQTTFSKATWSVTQTSNNIYTIQTAPVVYKTNAYFIARPLTGTNVNNNVYMVTASGSLSMVGSLPTQTSTERKMLSIMSGGVFGGAVMYIVGSQNVTAYSMPWNMMFNYKSNQTILVTGYPLTPVVLNTGAICFYTTYAFTVVGGFKGGLAWYYNTTSTYYPALTDNTTIFFTDGQYVIGADTYSGAVTSLSTYGSSNLRGFAIAAGPNSTTVIGATDDEVVFANQVISKPGAQSYFPGSGSAPTGGNGGDDGASKSKAWIAAVVIGVLVVIAAVAVVLKKRQDSATFDEDYVPMNPATQV